MNSEDKIIKQRLNASMASGGVSADPIYNLFIEILLEINVSGKLLDFGAGVGTLIKKIQNINRFETIDGADMMSIPAENAGISSWKQGDLNNTLDSESETYDVIVSSEVIEHLENPRGIVREWYRLLRPGGHLLFSTPNNESWRSLLSLILRGHYISFNDSCYPAHITPLLRKDIERILKESGFSNPHNFIYTDKGSVPKIPKITWQKISGGWLKGLRFSDNFLVLTQKPVKISKEII